MTDFSKTSARIRELVPRLMELSFGCVVDVCIQHEPGYESFVFNKWEQKGEIFIKTNHDEMLHIEEFGIIGHPIDLESVLDAVEKAWENTVTGGVYNGNVDLWRSKVDIDTLWKYGKLFDEQETETKQFITDIVLP